MRILVTGAAGFIGYHLAKRFLDRGDEVIGIDNLNDYYDVSLKKARIANLEPYKNFRFIRMDIVDRNAMEKLFFENSFDRIVHMAAQAGVRYSLENPHVYIEANIAGFLNVLEGCRHQKQEARSRKQETGNENQILASCIVPPASNFLLIYASSSSVYGANTKLPFSTGDRADCPVSLYAATKRADELMTHTYSHLYGIPTTGLRFFTVYGPWGRPDMALFKFTKAILNGEPIDVYNEGNMRRDFTYIDDIIEGVVRLAEAGSKKQEARNENQNPASCLLPHASCYRLYNIGNHSPVGLMDFIRAIEEALGKKAKLNFLPMQAGDVRETFADIDDLKKDTGFAPCTPIAEGVGKFVEWYKSYYK